MKFLVGYSGSEEAKAALRLAGTYAKKFDAKVIVVTSMGGGTSEKPAAIGQAAQNLAFAKQFLKEEGVDCETHQLARGMGPGEDVVSFAEQHDIDQIFVGIEKVSRTQKIIVGSNAQYIILKATCPVVTVRHYPR